MTKNALSPSTADEIEENKIAAGILAQLTGARKLPRPSKREFGPEVPGVYVARGGGLVKIGRAKNVAQRIRSLNVACPFPVIFMTLFDNDPSREGEYLRRFANLRVYGEWFEFRGELQTAVNEALSRARKAK